MFFNVFYLQIDVFIIYAASSAKADISKFLLLPSFDINLHFLFNNESSTDKQLNIVQDEVNQEESE